MVYIDENNIMYCGECEKRCYSEREAGCILNRLKHHRGSDHLGKQKELPRRKYWCKDCGHYHLTHLPKFSKESLNSRWENRFYLEYETREKSNRKIRKSA